MREAGTGFAQRQLAQPAGARSTSFSEYFRLCDRP